MTSDNKVTWFLVIINPLMWPIAFLFGFIPWLLEWNDKRLGITRNNDYHY